MTAAAEAQEQTEEERKKESAYDLLRHTNKNVVIRFILQNFPGAVTEAALARAELYEAKDENEEQLSAIRDVLKEQSKLTGVDIAPETVQALDRVESVFEELTEQCDTQLELFRTSGADNVAQLGEAPSNDG